MRFGPVPLDEARGTILAHTARLPGRVLRKGSVLDAEAIAALKEAGHTDVIAARLEPGDVPEDMCADRLADALVSPLVSRRPAATGRVNLRAEAAGVLVIDAARIDRINGVDEALTIGTLPNYATVAPRDIVATIKVIPFAAPGAAIAVTEAIARQGGPPMEVHPFRPLTVGLVMTELPGLRESVLEGAEQATAARVEGLTGRMLPAVRCAHTANAIADALDTLRRAGANLLLIVGASAVVDRRDVGPAGLVAAGGTIEHFGMPVDPGNLICIGRIGAIPAIVLPGCSRSPKLNGIDLVLSRLFAGLPVGPREVMGMGVGGLLKDVDARPLPREAAGGPTAARVGPAPKRAPLIAAVILAAGRSRRMAPRNKLLIAGDDGRPMIARVVDNVLASHARPVLVVTGHMAGEIEAALTGRPVRFVHAADYAEGLSASLRAGIAAVPPECAAALVCLGDMPLVSSDMLDRLLAAYDPDEGRRIVLPTYRGKQGNPMLWDRSFFPEIATITGDSGARHLLGQHLDVATEIEFSNDAVLRDFDTPDMLAPANGAAARP